jgi:hypothetical protein
MTEKYSKFLLFVDLFPLLFNHDLLTVSEWMKRLLRGNLKFRGVRKKKNQQALFSGTIGGTIHQVDCGSLFALQLRWSFGLADTYKKEGYYLLKSNSNDFFFLSNFFTLHK